MLIIHKQKKKAQHYTQRLSDEIGLDMVLVPGGTFLMGSPKDELDRRDSESPQHEVTVPSFFLGRYPITQAQWRIVAQWEQVERELNPNPSHFKGDDLWEQLERELSSNPSRFKGNDLWEQVERELSSNPSRFNDLPVESVSWDDAMEFCARLSRQTGQEYRLPTEAEWEYACRAGTQTPFHFGETITTELANYNGDYTYGDAPKGERRGKTTPVGYFGIANAFGLSDMHGNVWEWCLDSWHNNYEGAPTDGSAWLLDDQDATHVIRGGSWSNNPRNCRSACRLNDSPGITDYYIGFRVCRAAPRTR